MLSDLLNELTIDKNDKLEVTWKEIDVKINVPVLPEGYLYCNDCDAFTPHYKYDSKYAFINRQVCEVCEYEKDEDNMCECGYDFGDDHFTREGIQEVTLHDFGCHCNENDYTDLDNYDMATDSNGYGFSSYVGRCQLRVGINVNSYANLVLYNFIKSLSRKDYERLSKQIEQEIKVKCGCKKVLIFNHDLCIHSHTMSVYSLDCMNALEWEYELKCPVCSRVHYVQDGNC